MRGSYPDPEQSHGLNDGPLVSAIVPVYNGQSFVEQAIQSALSQTYRNIEIIVIDDGSTDGTLGIVHSYAASDSRIQIVQQLNGGVARARNRGIAMAKG